MATIHDEVSVKASATAWMMLYEAARIGMLHPEQSEYLSELTDKGRDLVGDLLTGIADKAMPVIIKAVEE